MSSTPILIRRGTAANWSSQNPILLAGQFAYEKDTQKLKVGDGVSRYNTLPYAAGGGGGSSTFIGLTDAASADIIGTNAALATAINAKQATLVGSGVGQNIKTVNGFALPGSGDIVISGGIAGDIDGGTASSTFSGSDIDGGSSSPF